MKNPDSHIILYAKGWYKRTDVVEDLKKIYSQRNNIDTRYLSIRNIADMIFRLCIEIMKDPTFCIGIIHTMSNFINDLRPEECWKTGYTWKNNFEEYNLDRAIIYKCLSFLKNLPVEDTKKGIILMPLDEPDFNILPKRKIK